MVIPMFRYTSQLLYIFIKLVSTLKFFSSEVHKCCVAAPTGTGLANLTYPTASHRLPIRLLDAIKPSKPETRVKGLNNAPVMDDSESKIVDTTQIIKATTPPEQPATTTTFAVKRAMEMLTWAVCSAQDEEAPPPIPADAARSARCRARALQAVQTQPPPPIPM